MTWLAARDDREFAGRLNATAALYATVRRAKGRYSVRLLCGVLGPFLHELAQEQARPVRDDLMALAISSDAPADSILATIERVLKQHQVPFAPLLSQPILDALIRPEASVPQARRLWISFPTVEVWMTTRPTVADLESPAKAVMVHVERPPQEMLVSEARSFLRSQVKAGFRQAWAPALATRRPLSVTLIEHDQIIARFTFATRGALGYRQAPAPGEIRRRMQHERDFVDQLLDVVPRQRQDLPLPVRGRIPDTAEVARWWAKHVLAGKRFVEIAEEERPDDDGLPDRIATQYQRLRNLDKAWNPQRQAGDSSQRA